MVEVAVANMLRSRIDLIILGQCWPIAIGCDDEDVIE